MNSATATEAQTLPATCRLALVMYHMTRGRLKIQVTYISGCSLSGHHTSLHQSMGHAVNNTSVYIMPKRTSFSSSS